MSVAALSAPDEERRRWMGVLARSAPEDVEAAWRTLPDTPRYRCLRPPEAGLVMVRARAEGSGAPFHLGEMTAARCTVEVEGGFTGTALVSGRRTRHAELCALLDALLQDPRRRAGLLSRVVEPLAAVLAARREERARAAAGTRVEFFTLTRGDDEP